MATRLWHAAYAGAARAPAELRLEAESTGERAPQGLLMVFGEDGRIFQLEPQMSERLAWSMAVAAGPVLTFQTPEGPVTLGPTRPAQDSRPAEFHLALAAAAPDPAHAVFVRLLRNGKPLTAVGPHGALGVAADQEVEPPGRSLDLYLEG